MPIFVSHSTQPHNKRAQEALDFIEQVIETFRSDPAHGHFDYFLDRQRLHFGDNFPAEIITWLAKTTLGIILVSKEAENLSAWVHFESGVMTWRQHFDDKILLLYILVGIERTAFEKLFSPQQVDRFISRVYNYEDKAALKALEDELRNLLRKHAAETRAWQSDPGYQWLREMLGKSGDTAAELLLASYQPAVPTGDWPGLFDRVAVVLTTAPVDNRTVSGFKNYLSTTTNAASKIPLMQHLAKQTTPLWYVSGLRSAFLTKAGAPIKKPSVVYISGRYPDLVKRHFARVFLLPGDYECETVTLPRATSGPISVSDLENATIPLQRSDPRAPGWGDTEDMDMIEFVTERTTECPVFIVVQSDHDIDREVHDYWTTMFDDRPAHLLVLRSRDAVESASLADDANAVTAEPEIDAAPVDESASRGPASYEFFTPLHEKKQRAMINLLKNAFSSTALYI